MSGPDALDLFAVLADDAPDLGTEEDLTEVRRAVTAMRRGQRLVDRRSLGSQTLRSSRWLSSLDWYRAAAVAVLSVGLVSLAGFGWRETLDPGLGTGLDTAALEGLAADGAGVESSAAVRPREDRPAGSVPFGLPAFTDAVPAIDGGSLVGRPPAPGRFFQPTTANVYELEGEDLDLVMVVHETLDV